MRNYFPIVLLLFSVPELVAAQKLSGTLECQTELAESSQIGTRKEHSYETESLKCVWKEPLKIKGIEIEGETRQILRETNGDKAHERGSSVGTFTNGDKYRVRWQQLGTVQKLWANPPIKGRWWFTGGKGDAEGIGRGGKFEKAQQGAKTT